MNNSISFISEILNCNELNIHNVRKGEDYSYQKTLNQTFKRSTGVIDYYMN